MFKTTQINKIFFLRGFFGGFGFGFGFFAELAKSQAFGHLHLLAPAPDWEVLL